MGEVFISLAREADLHQGETGQTGPTGPMGQIGETVTKVQVNHFNGRDAVIVRRLGRQLCEHRVDQDLAATFEVPPLDVLPGIVEFKRAKDGLEANWSVTLACWTKMCSLRRRPDQSHLSRYSCSPSNARRTTDISASPASGRIASRLSHTS
jgi:hypothetical protein